MNTFQLKCFLSAAELLNFAKAAKKMNTTQPTITHQIKSLEEELNVKLFNRSTRVVELTSAGLAFIDDAKSMISIEEQAKLRFSIANKQDIESVTIGCVSSLQINLLSNVLNILNLSIKNFHPIFVMNTKNHLLHLMDTEQLDVIFDLFDEKEVYDKYKFIELSETKIVGYCKKENPFDIIETLSSKDRFDAPIIFTNPTNDISNYSKFQLLLSNNLDIKNMHFAPSPETAIILAKSGIGIAILPSIYIQNKDSNMKKIALTESPNYKFGILYRTPIEKPIIKKFINIVKSEFPKLNYE